jgi:hypothetical protein
VVAYSRELFTLRANSGFAVCSHDLPARGPVLGEGTEDDDRITIFLRLESLNALILDLDGDSRFAAFAESVR